MRCYLCGYQFDANFLDQVEGMIACNACDSELQVLEGKLVEPLDFLISKERRLMLKALHEENFNGLKKHVTDLKKILPSTDLMVDFCEKLVEKKSGRPAGYEAFLCSPPKGSEGADAAIFSHVLRFLEPREEDQVKLFIAKISESMPKREEELRSRLKEAMERVKAAPKPKQQKQVCNGHSQGNMANGGHVLKVEEWKYYTGGDNRLYRAKGDTLCHISDDMCQFIHVIGDFVYYVNLEDGRLYRISGNGEGRKALSRHRLHFVSIVDQWAYCTNVDAGGKLMKLHVETGDMCYFEDARNDRCEYVNIYENYVYYCSEGEGGRLYKLHIDGERARVPVGQHPDDCININVVNNWVYYINASDGYKIYRISTDGRKRELLCHDVCRTINVTQDWIYYTKLGVGGIFKRHPDLDAKGESEQIPHLNDICWNIHVIDEWIYYRNRSQGNHLYRVKENGRERQPVN